MKGRREIDPMFGLDDCCITNGERSRLVSDSSLEQNKNETIIGVDVAFGASVYIIACKYVTCQGRSVANHPNVTLRVQRVYTAGALKKLVVSAVRCGD